MADIPRSDLKVADVERHFWLARSVARVLGVNLSAAMAQGRLSATQYSEMIDRCQSGGCHASCEAWLARPSGSADAAPAECRIARILERLR